MHCRNGIDAAKDTQEKIIALGRKATLLQFDVCDQQAAKQAIENDIEVNGVYYGVVCNAGITKDMAFPAMEKDDWSSVVNTA